jgi:antitoxin component YwqK of YwqJK toxin-antitoxin module
MKKTLFCLMLLFPFFSYHTRAQVHINLPDTFILNMDASRNELQRASEKAYTSYSLDTFFNIISDTFVSFQLYVLNDDERKNLLLKADLLKSEKNSLGNFVSMFHKINGDQVITNTGPFKLFDAYQSGQIELLMTDSIMIRMNLKNGYLDGTWESFFPNGQLMAEGVFKKHARAGLWSFYYENGVPMVQGSYYPDVLIFTQHDDDYIVLGKEYKIKKQFSSEEDFEKLLNKYLKRYNAASCPYPKVFYHPHGIWKFYNKKGEAIGEVKYKKGRKVRLWYLSDKEEDMNWFAYLMKHIR